jgi:hypothetical protein
MTTTPAVAAATAIDPKVATTRDDRCSESCQAVRHD